MSARLVVIESPMAGRPPSWMPWPLSVVARWYLEFRNRRYAMACVRHSALVCGEAPYASHVMFRSALRDRRPNERSIGMRCGFAWGHLAEAVAVYCDHGVSPGMLEGITQRDISQVVEYRYLFPWNVKRCPHCSICIAPTQTHCVRNSCISHRALI